MLFVNNTPLPAACIPGSEGDDRVTALFLCAITYRVLGGRLEVASGQRGLVLRSDESSSPPDAMWGKTGVSVCVTGYIYAPGGESRQTTALLEVGPKSIGIAAFGPRIWQKAAFTGALAPSTPLPFQRVAMTWQNAYGGAVDEPAQVLNIDGEEAFLPAHESAYPFNFDGVGFYTDSTQAQDHLLPQLEHPDQLIRRWDDRPEPVCFAPYPLWGGLRSAFVVRDKQFDMAGTSKVPSRAAPRTTFDAIEPGTRISLSGMRPRGENLAFEVPKCPVAVHVAIGSQADLVMPALDAVDLDAEAAEVRLLYRATVTYDLIQYEIRTAALESTEAFPET